MIDFRNDLLIVNIIKIKTDYRIKITDQNHSVRWDEKFFSQKKDKTFFMLDFSYVDAKNSIRRRIVLLKTPILTEISALLAFERSSSRKKGRMEGTKESVETIERKERSIKIKRASRVASPNSLFPLHAISLFFGASILYPLLRYVQKEKDRKK